MSKEQKLKSLKVPTWKKANSPSTLTKVGLNKKHIREANQRLHEVLAKLDYVFWDDSCIYDYSEEYLGYTITFKKLIDNHYYVFFSWRWTSQGHEPFWNGTMRITHRVDKETDKYVYQPWLSHEIYDITEKDIGRIESFELMLYKSLKANR